MEKAAGRRKQSSWLPIWLTLSVQLLLLLLLLPPVSSQKTPVRKLLEEVHLEVPAVQLSSRGHRQVSIDNGILHVTFSNPDGLIEGIKYNGIDNVLNTHVDDAGYWDVVWYEPDKESQIDKLKGTNFSVITQTEDQVEISFSTRWSLSRHGSRVPLNVDKRYIMRRGCSGVYMYAILERLEGWPDVDMDQIRIVFKLDPKKFRYMALSDERQRLMPTAEDRDGDRSQPLAYKEAVLLTNPTNPALRGEVDDKYQYSCRDQDNRVHGWISSDPPVGFWMITPSDEFRTSGPMKQDLTSHVGPTTLAMFTSTHYTGKDLNTEYRNGEPWKKVFGPVFAYLNSVPDKENNTQKLWEDAKKQMAVEVESWPYNFITSDDFPSADQRGTVTGQLQVKDWYIYKSNMPATFGYVGLAAPGKAGSWQREAKGYQFWTEADSKGYFTIKNVRPGNYSLYAWVPGFIGDYMYDLNITITPGSMIKLGAMVFEPPRNGATLWEIGIPDRSAAEFYIPDPYPTLVNRLYLNKPDHKFRQYGLWERYADLYPEMDLVYTVGKSDYTKDWFFAHVTRAAGNKTYDPTTWMIQFNLKDITSGNYNLKLALASAAYAEVQVRINDASADPVFSTGLIGKDNAIARHGIHGLCRLYSIDISSKMLNIGNNAIHLTQSRSQYFYQGVMYDYIRLEEPSRT